MPFLKCPQCGDWIQILGHGSHDVYDYKPCDRCIDKMDSEIIEVNDDPWYVNKLQ